ncbi:MAG: phasin family protein [Fibrobacterota bacterium]
MKNFIKGTLLGGIGLGLLTSERFEHFVRDMIKKTEMSREEGEQFFEELKEKTEIAQRDLEKKIQKEVRDNLESIGVNPEKDIKKLERKISALEKRITELENSSNDQNK